MEHATSTPRPDSDGFDPRSEPPPAQDWDLGGGEAPPRAGAGFDPAPVLALLEALRRGVPAELQQQWVALVREILLALRALIDWCLDRLDSGPRGPRVEDIPID